MYKIIDSRGSGKTSRLMLIAKEKNAYFVCANVSSMRYKAGAYGITGIDFISYEDYVEKANLIDAKRGAVIDDLDEFVKYAFKCALVGYTIRED